MLPTEYYNTIVYITTACKVALANATDFWTCTCHESWWIRMIEAGTSMHVQSRSGSVPEGRHIQASVNVCNIFSSWLYHLKGKEMEKSKLGIPRALKWYIFLNFLPSGWKDRVWFYPTHSTPPPPYTCFSKTLTSHPLGRKGLKYYHFEALDSYLSSNITLAHGIHW